MHVGFLNFNWAVSPKVDIYLDTVLAKSTGDFDAFNLPTPDIPEESPLSPENEHPKSDYDYSQIQNYSDLDYLQIEGTLGVSWKFAKQRSAYVSVSGMNVADDQPYVYGDLSGTLLMYAGGMTVGF